MKIDNIKEEVTHDMENLRKKIICSPSYADIRSRANITRGLNFDQKIKASTHKGDMRIGKTPKKKIS
jgi:hypothetical protein